jgi:hypothetical protein
MSNRTLSHPGDHTVSIHLKLPMSLRLAVDDHSKKTGKSMSELFREWASFQVNSCKIELIEIEQKEKRAEAELNIIRSQKSQLKEELSKQNAARKTRERLLDQTAERLIKSTQVINFKEPNFLRIFNNNLEDLNRILGSSGEPVTYEELKTLTIRKAETQEKIIL